MNRNMVDDPYFRLSAEGNQGYLCTCFYQEPDGTRIGWKDVKVPVGRVLRIGQRGK